MSKNTRKEIMDLMDGCEVWTDAYGDRFDERVCVMVEGNECWNNGKKFKPTNKEVQDMWEDYMTQEFGSKEQRARDLEAEFGGSK